MPITSTPYPVAPYSAGANTYTTTGSNAYTVPATSGGAPVSGVYVYLWGAGGGYNTIGGGGYVPGSAGGGGGFVSGFYSCSPGTNLIYVVGAVGVQSGSASALSNGGPGNPINPSPGGGGFSGLFLSNAGGIVQSNAIAIAGGGGGGGFEFGYMGYAEYGGGGGYPSGDNVGYDDGTKASSSYSGGSQTAGGLGDGPGSALLGGRNYVGGGGGGWYGGSGNGNGYGGTGGSSYIGNVNGATGGIGLTSGSTYENGITLTSAGMPASNAKPGGTTNQYYVSGKGVGNGGTGLVVIVPATQQRPTGAPVTRVPLTLTPYTQYEIQAYTGDYIYYSVPKNATGITFYMWGAGGGFVSNSAAYAGGGAFLTGILAISPGEQIRIIVGMGGKVSFSVFYSAGTDAQGGGGGGGVAGGMGGGRSAIQKYISNTWTEVVTAGGGGGAGNNAGDYGGNAYWNGSQSQAAGNTYGQYVSATGGSSTAAGLGAQITGLTQNYPANNGGAFYGGTALSNGGAAGGGGGGGYYGGGGGGFNASAEVSGGGGGGSYYNATYVSNFSGSNGNNITAVASSYSFYDGAAGRASASTSVPGSNGLVVLAPSYIRISATKTSYPVGPYVAGASNYTTTGSNVYTVPSTAGGAAVSGVYVYLWGAGGRVNTLLLDPDHPYTGAGAFVSGFYSCSPGTNLIYVVGEVGGRSLATGNGGYANYGSCSGGGFSGLFLSNSGGIAQSNAIAIAGGGGGSGWGQGGGGGYPSGGNGLQNGAILTGAGGTQTAGGTAGNRHDANGVNSLPGSALTGGTGGEEGGGAPEGGGGGGWYGGGGGGNASGGGGGSSYIGNVNGATGGIGLTSGAYYENGGDWNSGVVGKPGGTTNQFYIAGVGSGSNTDTSGKGLVVIVPATIQYPTPFSANT